MGDPSHGRPAWDQHLADSYLGKRILIGITYVDNEERPIEQVQLHGIIETADAIDGFRIGLLGNRSGQSWFLPPDPSAISPAAPGSYRLRSTGEIIENPDLITTWTVKKPVPEAE